MSVGLSGYNWWYRLCWQVYVSLQLSFLCLFEFNDDFSYEWNCLMFLCVFMCLIVIYKWNGLKFYIYLWILRFINETFKLSGCVISVKVCVKTEFNKFYGLDSNGGGCRSL